MALGTQLPRAHGWWVDVSRRISVRTKWLAGNPRGGSPTGNAVAAQKVL